MVVERVTLDRVKAKLAGLKRKGGPETGDPEASKAASIEAIQKRIEE